MDFSEEIMGQMIRALPGAHEQRLAALTAGGQPPLAQGEGAPESKERLLACVLQWATAIRAKLDATASERETAQQADEEAREQIAATAAVVEGQLATSEATRKAAQKDAEVAREQLAGAQNIWLKRRIN